MSQFARPIADISVGSWTNQAGGTSNLFQSIDETVPSDVDYVQCEPLLSGTFGFLSSYYVLQLGPIDDPETDAGLVLRFRASKDIAAGHEQDLIVELRQDYLNEADTGILITTVENFNLSETPTDFVINISEAEAVLITNFGSLFLRFVGRVGTTV